LQRKNRHLANAIHHLRNVPTSGHCIVGGHAAHDDARVVERKRVNANIADDGVYVVFEAADIVADRRFMRTWSG
jgi:hypothetical protein